MYVHIRAMVQLVAIGVILGVVFGVIPGATVAPTDSLPPCVTEDSTHCYWDASEMGNGVGNDVVSR